MKSKHVVKTSLMNLTFLLSSIPGVVKADVNQDVKKLLDDNDVNVEEVDNECDAYDDVTEKGDSFTLDITVSDSKTENKTITVTCEDGNVVKAVMKEIKKVGSGSNHGSCSGGGSCGSSGGGSC